jgi:hypothetical protein
VAIAEISEIPTIYGTGAYLRIGDAATAGVAANEDSLLVTGVLEVDGELELDGALDADGTTAFAQTINADATGTAISADGDIVTTGDGDDLTVAGGIITGQNSEALYLGDTNNYATFVIGDEELEIYDGGTHTYLQSDLGDIYINDVLAMGGNIDMNNKSIVDVWKVTLNVGGAIDPPYRIGDTVYSTYAPFMIGVKEEVTGTVKLNSSYIIDFKNLKIGSDLWLFYQVTDFGGNWENLQVILTPSFNGNVWYEKNPQAKTLIIHGSQTGEVSYRMTANGWNWGSWSNIAKNLDPNDYLDMGEKK